MKYILLALGLFVTVGCAEFREPRLSEWNPVKPDYHYPCPQPLRDVRYDADGKVYCQAPSVDIDNADVDALGLW